MNKTLAIMAMALMLVPLGVGVSGTTMTGRTASVKGARDKVPAAQCTPGGHIGFKESVRQFWSWGQDRAELGVNHDKAVLKTIYGSGKNAVEQSRIAVRDLNQNNERQESALVRKYPAVSQTRKDAIAETAKLSARWTEFKKGHPALARGIGTALTRLASIKDNIMRTAGNGK